MTAIRVERRFGEVPDALSAEGCDLRRLVAIVGEAALSEADRACLTFADRFEREFIHQGQANRTIEETFARAWQLLGHMPRQQLKRIRAEYIQRYPGQRADPPPGGAARSDRDGTGRASARGAVPPEAGQSQAAGRKVEGWRLEAGGNLPGSKLQPVVRMIFAASFPDSITIGTPPPGWVVPPAK